MIYLYLVYRLRICPQKCCTIVDSVVFLCSRRKEFVTDVMTDSTENAVLPTLENLLKSD